MASRTDPSHAKTHTAPDGTKYGYLTYPARPGKPTLLLLHGFPSSTWDWRDVLPLLTATGAGVIAPDLLGYGDSDKPFDPASYRMKSMTAHVEAVLAAEGVTRVVGVAHDWGCGLLSHMWVYAPQLFTRLAFISVGYLPPRPLDPAAINAATKAQLGYEIFGYWDFLNSEESPALLEQRFEVLQRISFTEDQSVYARELAPQGALKRAVEENRGTDLPLASWIRAEDLKTQRDILVHGGGMRGPTNWYRAAMRGVNNADYEALTDEQRKINVPVLFVATMQDKICVPAVMRTFMADYVSDLQVAEIESGHWALMEKPKELVNAISKFTGI